MNGSPHVLSGEVAERYAISGEIGRGGTAVVYRAHDRLRGIDVAMKVMREETMGTLSIERFLLEIRNTAKLPHPHIVPVLDSGDLAGRPYFVLPFMDGGTLRDKLRRHQQLQFEEVISLGITIARALEFAHAHGVIHRDVKPENILYNNGQPCLADFGTARALERSANEPDTSTGVVRGTPAYMSPEQATGEGNYDGRTDIYSLGCVLYEAVAGIQPFVGPSVQAVISQRLTHAPRPVSVYRPTVPAGLESVLAKATAILPADRFQQAGEFASALEKALTTVPVPLAGRQVVRSGASAARRAILGVSTIGLIAVAWTSVNWVDMDFPVGRVAADTTRVAIFPFEVSGDPLSYSGEDLMYEGLAHWGGLSVSEIYETKDAIRRRGKGQSDVRAIASDLSPGDAARVARSIGAGRYIRGRLINTLGAPTAYAALFDAGSRKPLHQASVKLAGSPADIIEAFASLADSLVLRVRGAGAPRIPHRKLSSAASVQAFLQGRAALDEWNLRMADSLFTVASALDANNVRAQLWRAQTRSWRGSRPTQWGSLAGLERADSVSLSSSEQTLAAALIALQAGRYSQACAIYQRMIDQRPTDFAGWYGLAECHRLDKRVVRDASSPSGWRFRSSYERAIQAYRKALEALPTSYRAVQGGGYEALQMQMFTDPQMLYSGISADSTRFGATATVPRDTAVFIPYPMATLARGEAKPDAAAMARAAARHRRMFADIARQWATAMPRSPGAKEVLAFSLEMVGDPSATTAYDEARRLATDPSQRLRLAVNYAIMRVKLAVSSGANDARVASLIDSILASTTPTTAADAELLSRLAALSGRCAQAGSLTKLAHPAALVDDALPPTILSALDSTFAAAASGCYDTPLTEVRAPLRRVGVDSNRISGIERSMLNAIAALRYPRDAARIRLLASANPDYVLMAAVDLSDGNRDRARDRMEKTRRSRQAAIPGSVSADVALTEARLWLALGDSATAGWLLDKSLEGLRYALPLGPDPLPNLLQLGSIASAAELRAAIATKDPAARRRWAAVPEQLWRKADPPLRARLSQLQALLH